MYKIYTYILPKQTLWALVTKVFGQQTLRDCTFIFNLLRYKTVLISFMHFSTKLKVCKPFIYKD